MRQGGLHGSAAVQCGASCWAPPGCFEARPPPATMAGAQLAAWFCICRGGLPRSWLAHSPWENRASSALTTLHNSLAHPLPWCSSQPAIARPPALAPAAAARLERQRVSHPAAGGQRVATAAVSGQRQHGRRPRVPAHSGRRSSCPGPAAGGPAGPAGQAGTRPAAGGSVAACPAATRPCQRSGAAAGSYAAPAAAGRRLRRKRQRRGHPGLIGGGG